MTIRASLNKEFLVGVRSRAFLAIAGSMLLPVLLEQIFPALHTGSLGLSNPASVLVVTFVLSGSLSREIRGGALLVPLTAGVRYGEAVLSKLAVFGFALFLSAIFATGANYLLDLLFGRNLSAVQLVMGGGALEGIYLVSILGWLLLLGTFSLKPLLVGLITLIPAFGTWWIGGILHQRIAEIVPPPSSPVSWLLPTALFIIILALTVWLAIIRLATLDLTQMGRRTKPFCSSVTNIRSERNEI